MVTSAIAVEGVLPPPVSSPRSSIPTTPLTLASRVVQPPVPTSIASASDGVVTGIPSIPTVPSSFTHTAQSGPVGSSTFVQGFPWNGGNIPPSTPYVGPSPSYVRVQFGTGIILGANFSPVGYFSMFFSQKRFTILHFL